LALLTHEIVWLDGRLSPNWLPAPIASQFRAGTPHIEIFSPLEDEFYSVLKTDGGGFDNAADRYAAASGHENARPATESDKGALGRVPGGSSKADTEGLKNQLLDFKTSIAEMRKKLAEKTGDQRDESES
jgi:hypothetical protein